MTPRTQAVEGPASPTHGGSASLPGTPRPNLMVGQAGPEWGWLLGEARVPGGKLRRGEAHVLPAPRPAPPLLPLPSSAPGSGACRGTLPPPQARRLTHLPGPGTCSPGNAREFSEDSISQGLREPQNSLDSAPGKAGERLGGWSTLGAPHLCLSYMLTSCGPQPTAVPSFIVRREKA